MAFSIGTKHGEKTFNDKELINIGSKAGCDIQLNLGFDFLLTVQFDAQSNKCIVLNQFNNPKFLFKGRALPAKLDIDKVCKIMVDGSDEFITVKVLGSGTGTSVAQENLSEQDIRDIYGNDINAAAKIKIEKRKAEIEEARVAIIKQVGATIADLKKKISMNSKSGIFLHIALFLASLVCAFGVSNYLTGLPLSDAGAVIQMPTNMKLIFVYAAVIFGIGLTMKQGAYLYLQNKLGEDTVTSKIVERFSIVLSSLFFVAVYFINVLYYITPKTMSFFAVLISLFFVGTAVILALSCGYFKHASVITRNELNEYEYRQDFEHVLQEYRQWIERFVNTLSNAKIRNIRDKQFNMQLKTVGELILGIITAPFLAYGVSNTLAMCFPEAAGWVRISGLRLSPIFLVLATFMIIFAFFSFVAAFTANKKIQASNVIKQDGFSNYLQHGVEIYGIEGIRKLERDKRWAFAIGLAIIFIEFTMNISYFMQEMGGDLKGMLYSAVAALVPTALLIAETFMMSQTRFESFACDELLAKIDKD